MPKYKVSVSKDQKKYSLVFNASSELEAKERVHSQWYSVLGVEKIELDNIKWKKIIFKALKDDKIKSWKIIWNDLFKVYLKLKDGLWYDIKELYFQDDENSSKEEKKELLDKIIKQYNLFHEINSKKKNKIKSKSEAYKEKINNKETKTDSFYLKKELENSYKLLQFVLEKFRIIFENKNFWNLDSIKVQKLKEIYNSLILLKTSTNISKIKEISELALLKLWEIELYLLEDKKDESVEKLLKQTNTLLKKLWSKEKFIPKEQDFLYQFNLKIEKIKNQLKNFKDIFKKKKKIIDKRSSFYLNTLLWIQKYKNKRKENNLKILKNIYTFILPFGTLKEKRDRILIERRLINSNLILLKSKIDRNIISYTKIKRWYNYFVDKILLFFKNIRWYLFLVIFFYWLLFLITLFLSYYNILNLWYLIDSINYRGVFYFIIFIFIYLAMYLSRWIFTLIINLFLVFILIIFWLINF